VHLKADINQLNLPHGTKTKNVDKKHENGYAQQEVLVKSPGVHGDSPKEKEGGYDTMHAIQHDVTRQFCGVRLGGVN